MSAAISPSEASAATRDGLARIVFAAKDRVTRLAHLDQQAPLRVLFPTPATADIPLAALVNTGGGMLAGDRCTVGIEVGAGARALVMPQAAEKVYRSDGAESRVRTALAVGPGGWLEYLPQETILFQDARFRRATQIDLAEGAGLMAGEMLVFGRIAHGERMTHGLARDEWRVRRAGRLVWADALHLEGRFAEVFARSSGFDGATACATFVHAGPGAAARLDDARALLDRTAGGPVRAGATTVGGILVARWLAVEPLALRRAFGGFWAAFRRIAAGLPAKLPPLWHV